MAKLITPKTVWVHCPINKPITAPMHAVSNGGGGFIRPGRSNKADSIGEKVSALNVESAIEHMIVTAKRRKMFPMVPLFKATGRNKDINTNDVETMAPNNSFMDCCAASMVDIPFWMFPVTDWTTRIASSTTKPDARMRAVMVKKLSVKPNKFKKKKVPTIETGIARAGMSRVRQFCKNNNKIRTTSTTASINESVTLDIESNMKAFLSANCTTWIPAGSVDLNLWMTCST